MDAMDMSTLIARLRDVVNALDAIDAKLTENRETFERKMNELIAALGRIGEATEDKLF